MNSIEKNDVDISRLFMWGKEFIIKEESLGFEEKVYIKLAGDEDVNRSRVYALRKSAELRKKLKDSESDERFAYIPEFEYVTREQLIGAVGAYFIREFTMEAVKTLSIPYPKEPKSDAPQEEHEEYQMKVDEYPTKREELIKEFIMKKLEQKSKELEVLSDTQLYREYERFLINQYCEDELQDSFEEMTVFLNTFSDSEYTKPYFSDLEQLRNLPSMLKSRFIDAYTSLEIGGEELKKLHEVTQ